MKFNFSNSRLGIFIPAIVGLFIWSLAPVFNLTSAATNNASTIGTVFVAPLNGNPIGNFPSSGFASYLEAGNEKTFSVAVTLNLPSNTNLDVLVGTTNVGRITMRPNRAGSLSLETDDGDTVPTVTSGATITVKNGNATVLTGTFGAPPTPTPRISPSPTGSPRISPSPTATRTPTPTPSPTATRTPTPTPSPTATVSPTPPPTVNAFKAELTGNQVVPAVQTRGRGRALVTFDSTTNKITVSVSFGQLSGAPSAITINGPAARGSNAPAIFNLSLSGQVIPGILPPQSFTVTPQQLADLRAGNWYFLVKTAANPNGEIRGQIIAANVRRDYSTEEQ